MLSTGRGGNRQILSPFNSVIAWNAAAIIVIAIAAAINIAVVARILLFVIVTVTAAVSFVVSSRAAHPVHALLQAWTITFAGFELNLISPIRHWPKEVSTLYLLAALTVTVIGASVLSKHGTYIGRRSSVAESLRCEADRYQRMLDICAGMGYVASAAFAYEMLVANQLNYADFAETRLVFMNKSASIFTYTSLITRVGGVIALFGSIVLREHLSTLRRWFYLGSGLSLSALAIFAAGRFIILQLMMTVAFAFAVRRALRLKRLPLISFAIPSAALALVFGAYLFYVSFARDKGGFGDEQYRYTLVSSALQIDSSFEQYFNRLPNWLRSAIVSGYGYGVLPMEHFAIFWNIHDRPPAWGLFQFQIVSRNLNRLFPLIPSGNDLLQQAYEDFVANGEPAFTWQTAIRDCIIDYGRTGTLMLCFLFGAACTDAFAGVLIGHSFLSMLRLLGLWMLGFHSGLYSLLGEPAVVTLLLLPIFMKGRKRMRQKTMFPVPGDRPKMRAEPLAVSR